MSHLQYCGMLEAFDKAAFASQPDKKKDFRLRTASALDIPQIRAIGGSATKKFGSIPELADLADDLEEPLTIQQWLALGRIYLAEELGSAIGFISAYPLDVALYVQEMSVLESHQGKGVGKFLMEAVQQWALVRSMQDRAKARVSLITYAEVPWNGPWYLKRGFKEVEPADIGPWHVQTADEDKQKLERPGFRRCCMLWEADPPPNASSDKRPSWSEGES